MLVWPCGPGVGGVLWCGVIGGWYCVYGCCMRLCLVWDTWWTKFGIACDVVCVCELLVACGGRDGVLKLHGNLDWTMVIISWCMVGYQDGGWKWCVNGWLNCGLMWILVPL